MNDIFKAIQNNDIEKVKELLDSGIDVNTKNKFEDTPLYEACYFNRIEIVKLLLEHPNIDVNTKDKYEMTPLYEACSFNHIEIVKLLLARSDIKIDFDYNEFIKKPKVKNLLKSYTYLYKKNINQILDTIEN